MPSFNKGPNDVPSPFGKNEFLRSTKGVRFQSYTCAAVTIPEVVIDGVAQKILPSGLVMAKITAAAGSSTAADVGKVGPFSAAALDGRQTLANIVGINDTFLPWQLMEHDEPIACVYTGVAKQGWCLEFDASDEAIVLTDTTANAMRGTKGLDVLFQ